MSQEAQAADRDSALPPEASASARALQPLRCDFCGALVTRVRRVALDRDYDRLQQPHAARYACADCSEVKERERTGG